MDVDYIEYYDYTPDNQTEDISSMAGIMNYKTSQTPWTHALVAINIFISAFGISGNLLVLWICGWKMKRTVITTWYTSLAISDFLFCACLPLEIFYMITSNWPFGLALCKLMSYALFLNMYSSVFLLVLVSVDRCVMIYFPVWAHNHRTVPKACAAVALMWIFSALLTLPSLIFRQTTVSGTVTLCHTNYMNHSKHKAVVLTRFVNGFLIPFAVIVVCSLLLVVKLKSLTMRSTKTKPYKVMAALILAFFFCWIPYHCAVLLELDVKNQNVEALRNGLKVGATLAGANSFISPVLYVFVGTDFKRTLKRSLTSRIEEAMAEDFRTGAVNHSRSKSMEVL